MRPRHNPRAAFPKVSRLPRLGERTEGRLSIVAYVHRYPPEHNAGGEWMLHELLAALVRDGCDCHVFADVDRATLDGVTMGPHGAPDEAARLAHANVLVTHLDRTRRALQLARQGHIPLVHIVHNDQQLVYHRVKPTDATAVVFNSRWIAAAHAWWRGSSVVVRPVIDPSRFAPARGKRKYLAALVNMTEPKGAPTLFAVAASMPRERFLAVRGAYGEQMPIPKGLRNIDVIEQTPDVNAAVYAKTTALLVPSSYESWGRVAVEAMTAGVPVVAHRTPGLMESCGDAALFAHRDRTKEWVAALSSLQHADTYDRMRAAGMTRAKNLAVLGDLDLAVWIDTVRRSAV